MPCANVCASAELARVAAPPRANLENSRQVDIRQTRYVPPHSFDQPPHLLLFLSCQLPALLLGHKVRQHPVMFVIAGSLARQRKLAQCC